MAVREQSAVAPIQDRQRVARTPDAAGVRSAPEFASDLGARVDVQPRQQVLGIYGSPSAPQGTCHHVSPVDDVNRVSLRLHPVDATLPTWRDGSACEIERTVAREVFRQKERRLQPRHGVVNGINVANRHFARFFFDRTTSRVATVLLQGSQQHQSGTMSVIS